MHIETAEENSEKKGNNLVFTGTGNLILRDKTPANNLIKSEYHNVKPKDMPSMKNMLGGRSAMAILVGGAGWRADWGDLTWFRQPRGQSWLGGTSPMFGDA